MTNCRSWTATTVCWPRRRLRSAVTGSASSCGAPTSSGPSSKVWMPAGLRSRLPGGCGTRSSRTRSHETIYAYVYSPEGQSAELARYLPERRKRRKPRKPRHARKPRGNVFPPDRAIQNRPEEVTARETFGDWEGDLMIFRKDLVSTNVASLIERKTRYAVLFRNNDRSSKMLMSRLINLLSPLPVTARRSGAFSSRPSAFTKPNGCRPSSGASARSPPRRRRCRRRPRG